MTRERAILPLNKQLSGPKLDIKNGRIDMSHGSGGRATAQLIDQLFLRAFNHDLLNEKNDFAAFPVTAGKVVVTTDAHVVSPLFFPGGDIGSLSVNGTVNDIAMSGASPLYLTASFIIEEGFPLSDLNKIAESMSSAASKAGVAIIAGDTKVVERGKADGVFITTTGVGVIPENIQISANFAQPGDQIILSGYIGDHGVAIMAHRNNLTFNTQICSDSAALNDLVKNILQASKHIHCMRDPTRGGLATALNELAAQSEVGFMIDESKIPVRREVESACELLGLDALYVANEGKLITICPKEEASKVLAAMRLHPLGQDAAIIGEVIEDEQHFVQLKTKLGGKRLIDWLAGEQLPRIC